MTPTGSSAKRQPRRAWGTHGSTTGPATVCRWPQLQRLQLLLCHPYPKVTRQAASTLPWVLLGCLLEEQGYCRNSSGSPTSTYG